MNQIEAGLCIYEEVHGLLREIEEKLLYMKTYESFWESHEKCETALNSLHAMAFLSYLNETLDNKYLNWVETFLTEVKMEYKSDRRFLMPYVLGLYLKLKHGKGEEKDDVYNEINLLIKKCKQENRVIYAIEYLFNISFFNDISSQLIENNNKKYIETEITEIAKKYIQYYNYNLDLEYKVKFLYILSTVSYLKDDLFQLYNIYRGDIENLRNMTRNENLKTLLLKPYMLLNVKCYKMIILNLQNFFQNNKYEVEQKNLLHQLSRYFILGQKNNEFEIFSKEINDKTIQLVMNFSKEKFEILQQPSIGISHMCEIGLALCISGFKRTYTIIESEIPSYIQFRKAQEYKKFIRVPIEGLNMLLNDVADIKYQNILYRNALFFCFSCISAIILMTSLFNPQDFKSYLPIIIYIILTEFFDNIAPKFKDTFKYGYSIITTILHKTKIKMIIRKEYESLVSGG